jgi:hypothetical protein
VRHAGLTPPHLSNPCAVNNEGAYSVKRTSSGINVNVPPMSVTGTEQFRNDLAP